MTTATDGSRRRWLVIAAGVGLVAVLLGGVAALAGDDDEGATRPDRSTTTEARVETTATVPSTAPTTTAPSSTTAPATSAPTTTTTAVPVAPPVGGGAPGTTVPTGGGSGPNAPPRITSSALQGTATMQTRCNLPNSGRTVAVTAVDDRGVANVVLRWVHSVEGPDQVPMLRAGSGWVGSFGPFDQVGTVTYEAVATDTDGATATSPGGTVVVEGCPG